MDRDEDRVLSGQVCFRPTPLMCYGALSCFLCSWLWEQLTKPEPRRLVGSRAPSVGGMRGSSWPRPLLQEQLEANGVHMRSEPLVFISAQGASETHLCSILQQTVCCEGILTVFSGCLHLLLDLFLVCKYIYILIFILKETYFGKFTFIRCLNTNVYPQFYISSFFLTYPLLKFP